MQFKAMQFMSQLYSWLGAWLGCCGNPLWLGLLILQQLGSKRKNAKRKCSKREEINIPCPLKGYSLIGITSLYPLSLASSHRASTDTMQQRINANSQGKCDKEIVALFNQPDKENFYCFMG